ncbi:hypothetical protein PsYK624_093830 [Phanerochaete sordida]|uniref:Uncharacterized protein n=1 Tax=Phanerochaete sordida TaxID=48140 RepID=A0A9P3GF70_9APHY|nr:hypothetical protein PsYK624_093830 [Phanerochaete sordida]
MGLCRSSFAEVEGAALQGPLVHLPALGPTDVPARYTLINRGVGPTTQRTALASSQPPQPPPSTILRTSVASCLFRHSQPRACLPVHAKPLRSPGYGVVRAASAIGSRLSRSTRSTKSRATRGCGP